MEWTATEMRACTVSAARSATERIREADERRRSIRQSRTIRLSAGLPIARHKPQFALQRARLLAGRSADL